MFKSSVFSSVKSKGGSAIDPWATQRLGVSTIPDVENLTVSCDFASEDSTNCRLGTTVVFTIYIKKNLCENVSMLFMCSQINCTKQHRGR